jgi:hypothetical protein
LELLRQLHNHKITEMKDNKTHSRRKFISKSLYLGSMFLSGAFLLGASSVPSIANDQTGLDGQEDPEALLNKGVKPAYQDSTKQVKKDPCDDMTGVSPAELAKRKKLAYVNKSPIEDSHCGNCALYLHPAKGKACGGCVLFKGPVRPGGYCAYWAPISE